MQAINQVVQSIYIERMLHVGIGDQNKIQRNRFWFTAISSVQNTFLCHTNDAMLNLQQVVISDKLEVQPETILPYYGFENVFLCVRAINFYYSMSLDVERIWDEFDWAAAWTSIIFQMASK